MGYESTDSKIDIELSVIECTICFVNEQNTVLPCAHKVCENCYEKITECPFCRNKINKPITNTIANINYNIVETVEITSSDRKFYIFISIVSAGPIGLLFYGMSMFSRPR